MKNTKQLQRDLALERLNMAIKDHLKDVLLNMDFPDFDPARAERSELLAIGSGLLGVETNPANFGRIHF